MSALGLEIFPLDRFDMTKQVQDEMLRNDEQKGRVQEDQQWHRTFNRYNLTLGPLTDSGVNTFEKFYYSHTLPDDHEPAFLFEDPKDHKVVSGSLGSGNGSSTVFRFKRTHSTTNESQTEVMRFLKSGTVEVFKGGSSASPSVNREVGIATFSGSAPASGTEVKANFEFYKMVQFVDDPVTETMENGKHQTINVTLEEVEA